MTRGSLATGPKTISRRNSNGTVPASLLTAASPRFYLSFFLSFFFFSTAGDDLFRVIRDDRKLQRVHWPKRRETSARVDSRKRSSPRGGRSNRRCCVKSFVCSPRIPSTRWMPMIKLSSVFLKFSVPGIYARFAFFKLHVLFCEEAVATKVYNGKITVSRNCTEWRNLIERSVVLSPRVVLNSGSDFPWNASLKYTAEENIRLVKRPIDCNSQNWREFFIYLGDTIFWFTNTLIAMYLHVLIYRNKSSKKERSHLVTCNLQNVRLYKY